MSVDYELVLADLKKKRGDLDAAIQAFEEMLACRTTAAVATRAPARERAPKAVRPRPAVSVAPEVEMRDCPGCGRKTGQMKECDTCAKELCARKCLRGSKTTCTDCTKRPG